jgi:uncharacterized protein YecT (DUF1311 family)
MKSTFSARSLLLAAAVFSLAAQPLGALAQQGGGDPGLSKEFKPCMDKVEKMTGEPQAQAAFGCLDGERKKQDARVARVYNAILAKLPEEGKKRLTNAQSAWGRFKDAQCAFYAEPEGPIAAKATNAECRLSITVGRANELENINSTLQAQAPAPARGPLAQPSGQPSAPAPAPAAPATNMGSGTGLALPSGGGLSAPAPATPAAPAAPAAAPK